MNSFHRKYFVVDPFFTSIKASLTFRNTFKKAFFVVHQSTRYYLFDLNFKKKHFLMFEINQIFRHKKFVEKISNKFKTE